MIITLPQAKLGVTKKRYGGREWIRELQSVDPSGDDGYAFKGPERDFGEIVEVPPGTWFLAYHDDLNARGELYRRNVILYRVSDGGLDKVRGWDLQPGQGWALIIRDEIAALLAGPPDSNPVVTQYGTDILYSLTRKDAEGIAGRPITADEARLISHALGGPVRGVVKDVIFSVVPQREE